MKTGRSVAFGRGASRGRERFQKWKRQLFPDSRRKEKTDDLSPPDSLISTFTGKYNCAPYVISYKGRIRVRRRSTVRIDKGKSESRKGLLETCPCSTSQSVNRDEALKQGEVNRKHSLEHSIAVSGSVQQHKHVILNHGPDLDKVFLTQLKGKLIALGLHTFMDAESFEKVKHYEFLGKVHAHVVIFSKDFAKSKFCLNELSDMLRSEKPLFIVFYGVEPKDLLSLDGPFATPLGTYMDKGWQDDVRRWKRALEEVTRKHSQTVTCPKLDNDSTVEEKVIAEILNGFPYQILIWSTIHIVPKPSFIHVEKLSHAIHPMEDNVEELSHAIHPMEDNVEEFSNAIHPMEEIVEELSHAIHPMEDNVEEFSNAIYLMQAQQLEVMYNLISRTEELLGIQQILVGVELGAHELFQIGVELGAHELFQIFQDNGNGIIAGRLDTSTMQIQIIVSDLKAMVDITGVGLDLKANLTRVGLLENKKLALVTGGNDTPTKVSMRAIDKQVCAKLSCTGVAFNFFHFVKDTLEYSNDYTCSLPQGEEHQASSTSKPLSSQDIDFEDYGVLETVEDKSTYVVYKVHSLAKLLLLLESKKLKNLLESIELGNKSFWVKIKEFSSAWDWQDVNTALVEYETSWRSLQSKVQFKEHGSGGIERNSSQDPSSSYGQSHTKGKSKIGEVSKLPENNHDNNGEGGDKGGGDGVGDGGDGGDGRKKTQQEYYSKGKDSYDIEVLPGYDEFECKTYKNIQVNIDPSIYITWRNCSKKHVREKEIHVKSKVRFDLANESGPSPQPSNSERKHFAWYHDRMKFSFRSEEKDAAELVTGSENLLNVWNEGKSTNGHVNTNNSPIDTVEKRFEAKGSAGGMVELKGSVGAKHTFASDSKATEKKKEAPNPRTQCGFVISNKSCGGANPSVCYEFWDDDKVAPHLSPDGSIDADLYARSSCGTITEAFEGTFRPKKDIEDYYPYVFECRRDLKGHLYEKPPPIVIPRTSFVSKLRELTPGCSSGRPIENDGESTKDAWKMQRYVQEFHVNIFINHKMTHFKEVVKTSGSGRKFNTVTGPLDLRKLVLKIHRTREGP